MKWFFPFCFFQLVFSSFISFSGGYPSVSLQEIEANQTEKLSLLQEAGISNHISMLADVRIYPTAYDKEATLLIHLKQPAADIKLTVINPLGKASDIYVAKQLKGGFYEISVPTPAAATGLFMARLTIDGQVYSTHLIR